jgi:hypothetical protein
MAEKVSYTTFTQTLQKISDTIADSTCNIHCDNNLMPGLKLKLISILVFLTGHFNQNTENKINLVHILASSNNIKVKNLLQSLEITHTGIYDVLAGFYTPLELDYKLSSNTLISCMNELEPFSLDYNKNPENTEKTSIKPFMISSAIESLLNREKRSHAGIFYTPEDEIEVMCRLSLAEYLLNSIPYVCKEEIYSLIFNDNAEPDIILKTQRQHNMYLTIYKTLKEIKMFDPACGTGLFALKMYHILVDLVKKLETCISPPNKDQYNPENIIINNIYNMDIESWAVQFCLLSLLLSIPENCKPSKDQLQSLKNHFVTANLIETIKPDKITLKDYFSEVFNKKNSGFDIIASNPPYVRQELIQQNYNNLNHPENLKKQLAEYIESLLPYYFSKDKHEKTLKISSKSDLYIYFFFTGISLLNNNGILTYITSNSWLDVDYGACLRDFLGKHTAIKYIIDTLQAKSFHDADINTVITVISNRQLSKYTNIENHVRFVNLFQPYGQLLKKDIISDITCCQKSFKNIYSEVKLVRQSELIDDNKVRFVNNLQYSNNKKTCLNSRWGCSYLRAPAIYKEIEKQFSAKFIYLKDITDIRFGIKSGANNFFYLDKSKIDQWQIESDFIRPFLFSLKDIEGYQINSNNTKRYLFYCHKSKDELKKGGFKNALAYISQGEAHKYHYRPSVKNRPNWYSVPRQEQFHFVSNRFIGERFGFPGISELLVGDVFFTGAFKKYNTELCLALLNSTLSYLSAEVLARKTYGLGIAYLYGPEISNITIPDPSLIAEDLSKDIIQIHSKMKERKLLKIHDEINMPDRRELDYCISILMGLSDRQQNDIYDSLKTMVEARLKKARNLASC